MATKWNANEALAASKSWRTQSELTRAKIRTSQLVNRLQDFAEGKPGVEMSPAQVKAAQVVLDKTLPSLSMQDIVNHTVNDSPDFESMVQMLEGFLGKEATSAILSRLDANKSEPKEQTH